MSASRVARIVFRWLAWLFVACLVVQFFLAGLAVFAGASNWELHRSWAFTFGYLLPVLLIASLVGRMPRGAWGATLLLMALFTLQSVFVSLRSSAPVISALHPVNAVAIFTLALWMARSAAEWERRAVANGALADQPATIDPPSGESGEARA